MGFEPFLEVRDLTYTVSGQTLLADVSFTVGKGEFVSIVGPSGAGKSTLLKLIAGLLPAKKGQILVEGKRVSGPQSRHNLMFQKPTLLPWLNVKQNVAFALLFSDEVGTEDKEKLVREALRVVGLLHKEKASVSDLSGGEMQRVALARSLVLKPKLLLLDEPFSALDIFSKEMLQHDLLEIVRMRNITTILVSHFLDEAVKMSDRILLLDPHAKKISRELVICEPRDGRSDAVVEKYLRQLESKFRELAYFYNESI
ncbi:MAG: ABC transporter ATP-binding protein [Leptospiraceae bacterium]|nr:ABC transporter ATP-binding protein [Leptospiraceae bacterium]MDW8305762.1 ABC transporter ATP-binding protein [Leptospiraceae bacterium]